MADFSTAVKYKLPIKVVIIKNNTPGPDQVGADGVSGQSGVRRGLGPIDFVAFAHACGGVGYSVDDPKNCSQTVEQFLSAPGPAILEAVVDPFEPPLPGRVKADQALKFAQSLARGEPNRSKIALTVASDKVRELV